MVFYFVHTRDNKKFTFNKGLAGAELVDCERHVVVIRPPPTRCHENTAPVG
jgi:hypothetical protein